MLHKNNQVLKDTDGININFIANDIEAMRFHLSILNMSIIFN